MGFTQAELDERAKLSSIYVGRVENGRMRRGLSLGMAFKVAKGLDVTLADLLGGASQLGLVGVEAGHLSPSTIVRSPRAISRLRQIS